MARGLLQALGTDPTGALERISDECRLWGLVTFSQRLCESPPIPAEMVDVVRQAVHSLTRFSAHHGDPDAQMNLVHSVFAPVIGRHLGQVEDRRLPDDIIEVLLRVLETLSDPDAMREAMHLFTLYSEAVDSAKSEAIYRLRPMFHQLGTGIAESLQTEPVAH